MILKFEEVVDSHARKLTRLYRPIISDLFTGIFTSNPDPSSAAREQRSHQVDSQAGQNNDHRGTSHLAHAV